MSAKKSFDAENPWVKPEPVEEADENLADDQAPPSPWSQEVPPPPWARSDPDPIGGDESDADGSGQVDVGGEAWGDGGDAAWGAGTGPPSLRRPVPEQKWRIPPLALPIVGGLAVMTLIVVILVLLTNADHSADPNRSTPGSGTTYSLPPNAIAVGFGVSVVPVDGWTPLTQETQGKELMSYGPDQQARAFFWVRQKQDVSAKDYVVQIVEGETQNEITQLGREQNLPCSQDALVECSTISYTSMTKAGGVQGYVEAYRRKDGVVTAIDFRTRTDFAQKAEAEAAVMKRSVIDTL